jgi:hypothetical protein
VFACQRVAFSRQKTEFATKNMNDPERKQEVISTNELIETALIMIMIAAIDLATQSPAKKPVPVSALSKRRHWNGAFTSPKENRSLRPKGESE